MAKAHIEMEYDDGNTTDWTLDEYESFLRGTGEWPSVNTEAGGRVLTLPSGCYFIPAQYTRPDEDGAVV
jgi:hypothetical protein